MSEPLTSRRWPHYLISGCLLTVLAVAYAHTIAPGLTWANDGADGGDLVTAAATLGIAHPTGYPTYLLLVHLFQFIPVGDLAFRANLFSAVCAIMTVGLVYTLSHGVLGSPTWPSTAAAGSAALGFGLSPVFWSQAVIAEVHSLHALCVALVLLFILSVIAQHSPPNPWTLRGQACLIGLALGNHVTLALLALVWLITLGAIAPASQRWSVIGQALVWLSVGLLVYLYLPLRALTYPAVNWGNSTNWSGFWWVVSGQPYRELALGVPAPLLSQRSAAWAALLVSQFSWVGLGLGCFGLLYGQAPRHFLGLTSGLAVGYSLFALTYNTRDSYVYLIPVYLLFALWISLGIHRLLTTWQRWHPQSAPLVALILIIALVWPMPATARQVDASQDTRAITYATTVLTTAPSGALIVTSADRDTFPLWYYQYALGERPDIRIIVEPLLAFAWYRDHLKIRYPTLYMPATPRPTWLAAITAANQPTPVCRIDLAAISTPQALHCEHSVSE